MAASNLQKTDIPDRLEKKKKKKQIGLFYQAFPGFRNLNLMWTWRWDKIGIEREDRKEKELTKNNESVAYSGLPSEFKGP